VKQSPFTVIYGACVRYSAPLRDFLMWLALIVAFSCARGAEPVREWLRGMQAADRKIVGEDIKTVQYGWPLGMPLVRKMPAELWEVWSDLAEGIATN
jgi:hypothetical protein